MEQNQTELLAPEGGQDFPQLSVTTHLEAIKEAAEGMAKAAEIDLVWAPKIKVMDAETRAQAIAVGKSLKSCANKIQEARIKAQAPLKKFVEDSKAICDDVCKKLLDAEALINAELVRFAEEQKAEEERKKREALAKLEAERKRLEAEARERQAEEDRRQAEEAERIAKAREEAKKAAKKNGQNMTAITQADEAAAAERARIEAERAVREKEEADRKAAADAALAAAEAKAAAEIADAKGKGKTKAVQEVWNSELLDLAKVPRRFLSLDETKVRKYLASGAFEETDPLKIIDGMRCWKALSARKG